jgi:hypothetical protein
VFIGDNFNIFTQFFIRTSRNILKQQYGTRNKKEGSMRQNKLLCAVLTVFFVLSLGTQTMAGEVDILVRKLVEKGILNKEEGDKILQETKQEAAKEKEQAVKEAKAAVAKDAKEGKFPGLPEWIAKTKFTGDFRLRYQWESRQIDSTSNTDYDRNRGRVRVRLGLETEVAKNLKFLFGLASGSNDPRSTNFTFSGDSDKKQINIDYAYVDYTPYTWMKAQAGKMKNPVYKVSELMWDEDINPEGAAAQFNWNIRDSFSLFMNAGVFVVEEYSKDANDPYMYVFQPGFIWKPGECTQLKYALGYTEFDNLKGNSFKYSSGSNTLVLNKKANKVLKYDYNAITMAGELGFKGPFRGAVPYCALIAEYAHNTHPSSNNNAYLTGFYFGQEKVRERGQWQVKYMWRRIERDAVPDFLPESEFYAGSTDVQGSKLAFQYGLMKNVWMGLNYYRAGKIHGDSEVQNMMQTDLNLRF